MSRATRHHSRRASRQKLTRESTQNGGPSTVAGTVGALPLVEHAPYRPDRTLPLRVELVRSCAVAARRWRSRSWRCCR